MRILELENRCSGNRTVGSNPTLSAIAGTCGSGFKPACVANQISTQKVEEEPRRPGLH
jgi:hypothetical protein